MRKEKEKGWERNEGERGKHTIKDGKLEWERERWMAKNIRNDTAYKR